MTRLISVRSSTASESHVEPRAVAEDTYQLHELEALAALKEHCSPVYCERHSAIVQEGFALNKWIHATFRDYHGYSPYRFVAFAGDQSNGSLVRADFLHKDNKFMVEVHGREEHVAGMIDFVKSQTFFCNGGIQSYWVYGQDANNSNEYERTLEVPAEVPGAYPWLGGSVEELAKEFFASTESFLFVLGPPGTGKTTLVKQLAGYANTGLMFTYDSVLLGQDGFFSNYMAREECNILLLEDADGHLGRRVEGNPTMAKFLNASDGMMKVKEKKIIITTNLPNTDGVDEALLRPGRCFGTLTTRLHTREEARAVAQHLYRDIYTAEDWSNKEYTLAQVMNARKKFRGELAKRSIGFVS